MKVITHHVARLIAARRWDQQEEPGARPLGLGRRARAGVNLLPLGLRHHTAA